MNVSNNERSPGRFSARGEDARFDRLVDGELSPQEYQALVAALDDEPGGWRQCALAFLEAQALAQEMAALRRGESGVVSLRKTRTSARRASGQWLHYLAMAASFLVALAIGIALPSLWRPAGPPASRLPDVRQPGQVVDGSPQLQPPERMDMQPQAVASARLVISGPDGTTEAGELPIYELSGNTGDWLGQQQALPVMLVDELARRGHRVERQQQYVPVDLGDGRRAVIPVEAIQVTPVSRRAY